MDGIQPRTTQIRSPRTNGFERMNHTLLDECFRVAGRTTWYLEPAEIQRDLDRFLEYYTSSGVIRGPGWVVVYRTRFTGSQAFASTKLLLAQYHGSLSFRESAEPFSVTTVLH
jgi:hypothetical protein